MSKLIKKGNKKGLQCFSHVFYARNQKKPSNDEHRLKLSVMNLSTEIT